MSLRENLEAPRAEVRGLGEQEPGAQGDGEVEEIRHAGTLTPRIPPKTRAPRNNGRSVGRKSQM